MAADDGLRPSKNKTNADRCQADLMYTKLSFNLLTIDIDAMNIFAYVVCFFVQFPTKNIAVPNSMANDVNLDNFAPWSCQL
jgi:hypothetical protein